MDPCFPHNPQGFQFFHGVDEHDHDHVPTLSHGGAGAAATEYDALTYHVAMLRDKVQQLEPLVGMVVSPATHHLRHEAAAGAMAASSACSVLQEITAAASAVAHRLELHASFSRGSEAFANESNEQMFPAAHQAADTSPSFHFHHEQPAAVFGAGAAAAAVHMVTAIDRAGSFSLSATASAASTSGQTGSEDARGDGEEIDVVDLDASYLLARYTHHCEVCGKGFKRDANLRMHMRAHGDEYKTSAALSKPAGVADDVAAVAGSKRCYSCPADGCRWNRRHPRFQPLKSVVCAKNHYRRSHCPKMYVCRRCGGKQFAVLSDLRTHEKHCGELRWRCSCGTFFSRKDKLMGHVALFATGHMPVPVAAATAKTPAADR